LSGKANHVQVAIAKKSFRDDPHCGDECAYWADGNEVTLCVVDGLGHGGAAEEAAQAAVSYVGRHLAESLLDIFTGCDRAIRHTRGGVMGIAIVDTAEGALTYAGVGNPRAMVVRAQQGTLSRYNVKRLSSVPGTVGMGIKRLLPETIPLNPGDLVILFTDGIPEKMDLRHYDDALFEDVDVLAKQILQDWGRKSDDAAILLFKNEGA